MNNKTLKPYSNLKFTEFNTHELTTIIKESLLDDTNDETIAKRYIALRRIQKAIDNNIGSRAITGAKENVFDSISNIIEKDNGKFVLIDGVEISLNGGRTTYNYEVCEHLIYDTLISLEVKIKEFKKVIETELESFMQNDDLGKGDVTLNLSMLAKLNNIITENYNMIEDTFQDNNMIMECKQPQKITKAAIKVLKL